MTPFTISGGDTLGTHQEEFQPSDQTKRNSADVGFLLGLAPNRLCYCAAVTSMVAFGVVLNLRKSWRDLGRHH
jgi:hypothetical protein